MFIVINCLENSYYGIRNIMEVMISNILFLQCIERMALSFEGGSTAVVGGKR